MVRKGLGVNADYSPAERRADGVIHLVGVLFALMAAIWLIARRPDSPPLTLYAAALVGVLGSSAAYHFATGPLKERLRRLDHAMIFIMIAATYTPLVSFRLPPEIALPLGATVWTGCAFGVVIKLAFPRRFDRLSIALYLAMGWAVAWALAPLSASLSELSFTLLVAGGMFYTLGVPFCLFDRLPFHNALWHACVLAGAMAHFATMAVEFV